MLRHICQVTFVKFYHQLLSTVSSSVTFHLILTFSNEKLNNFKIRANSYFFIPILI